MVVSKNGKTQMKITPESTIIEQVESFKYVGGEIASNGSHQEDIKQKIGKGLQTMGRLRRIWSNKGISIKTKVKIYNCSI